MDPTQLDELASLTAHLDSARNAVLNAVLSASETTARRPGIPSGRTLLGLISDLTVSEQYWFGFVFAGGPERHWSFGGGAPANASVAEVISGYQRAIEHSNAIIAQAPSLAEPAAYPPFPSQPISLRWVMTQMIEETARHAGHADILVEQAARTAS